MQAIKYQRGRASAATVGAVAHKVTERELSRYHKSLVPWELPDKAANDK